MKIGIKSSRDFATGCAFLAFGIATAALSTAYPLGTSSRMGPGYFPTMLGLLLAAIGVAVALRSVASPAGGSVGAVHVWLLARLLLSLVVFGLLLPVLGLPIAGFVTVLAAAWAGPQFRLAEGAATAAALSILSWLIFVVALKQTIPVWPLFLR